MMSSEEEEVDENNKRCYIVRKPEWRHKRFQKLVTKIDEEYQKSSSKRAKQQTIERKEGSPSRRSFPENRLSDIVKNFPTFINIPTNKNSAI